MVRKYERLSKRLDEEEEQRKKREEAQALAAREMMQGCSHDHSKERQIYEKPTSEKIDAADRFRSEGNAAFREKNYGLAAVNYRKALLQFDYTFPDTPEEQQRMDSVKLPCHLNLAACKLHQQEYDEVYIQCRLALEMDPNNVKALYRRGLAYLQQDHFEKAKKDLLKAQSVEPVNREVRDALVLLREKIQRYKRRSLKTYKAMLQGTEQPRSPDLPVNGATRNQPSCSAPVACSQGFAPKPEDVDVSAASEDRTSSGSSCPLSSDSARNLSSQQQHQPNFQAREMSADKAASRISPSPEKHETQQGKPPVFPARVVRKSRQSPSRSRSPLREKEEGDRTPNKVVLEGVGAQAERKEGGRAGGNTQHLGVPGAFESGFRRLSPASRGTTESALYPLPESRTQSPEAKRPGSRGSSPRARSSGDQRAEKAKSPREGQRNGVRNSQRQPALKSEVMDSREKDANAKKTMGVEPKKKGGSRLLPEVRKTEGVALQSDSADADRRDGKRDCLSPSALKRKTGTVVGRGKDPKKGETSCVSPQKRPPSVGERYKPTSSPEHVRQRRKIPGLGSPGGLHNRTGPTETTPSSQEGTPTSVHTIKKQVLAEALRIRKSKAPSDGDRDEKGIPSFCVSKETVDAMMLSSGDSKEVTGSDVCGKCCVCGRDNKQVFTKTQNDVLGLPHGVWVLVSVCAFLSCVLGVLVGLVLAGRVFNAEIGPGPSWNATSERDGRYAAGTCQHEQSAAEPFSTVRESSPVFSQVGINGGVLLSGIMTVMCVLVAIVMLYCGTSGKDGADSKTCSQGVSERDSLQPFENDAWSSSVDQSECSEGETWKASKVSEDDWERDEPEQEMSDDDSDASRGSGTREQTLFDARKKRNTAGGWGRCTPVPSRAQARRREEESDAYGYAGDPCG
ncbi:tetratricopeptide repeat-containing protein [Cystoisospora suis]|uniref:Tetratricopeptide repeat-containing protein n=1 Tax=Cystoisospora suis TaxID=483139 RepID=A0A2C6L042_9APIC|nr:tetratricopeptide repeat-containing protein [Cystoisospora suis]